MKSGKNKVIGVGMALLMMLSLGSCSLLEDTDTTEAGKGDQPTELTTVTDNETDRTEDENQGEPVTIATLPDNPVPTEEVTTEVTTEAMPIFTDRPYANDGTGQIKNLREGDVAPDFTANLTDGSTFRLSDYDNKVVLLNFFATWCGPCMGEMPAFENLKNDGYDDLQILCVDCMEDTHTVDQFVKEYGYTFPIAYDERGTIEDYYPTDGIPYTLVIDHGIIKNIYVGAYSAEEQYREYKSAIDACIN